MAQARRFQQVDVFTHRVGWGNPLAVVLDAEGLDEHAMQRFARWTNLSETVFVLPPVAAEADYRVRIFTPGSELPFAGHPTLGTAHAWLSGPAAPKQGGLLVQECAAGLIPVRCDDASQLAFAAPPLRRAPLSADLLPALLQALGLHASDVRLSQQLDNGPVWHTLWLHSADAVLAVQPDLVALRALGIQAAVAGPYPVSGPGLLARANREARAFAAAPNSGETPHIEVRAFAPAFGVAEDSVTGSLNASLAQWLIAEGELPAQYVAAQGWALERAGRIHLSRAANGQVWVAGHCVTAISGSLRL